MFVGESKDLQVNPKTLRMFIFMTNLVSENSEGCHKCRNLPTSYYAAPSNANRSSSKCEKM